MRWFHVWTGSYSLSGDTILSLTGIYSYEERQESIRRIVKNHKHLSMFEEFASRCFSPAPSTSSRPSTPAGEYKSFMRTQTAPSSLLEQDSIRNRSKSTGNSLIGQNSELGKEDDTIIIHTTVTNRILSQNVTHVVLNSHFRILHSSLYGHASRTAHATLHACYRLITRSLLSLAKQPQ